MLKRKEVQDVILHVGHLEGVRAQSWINAIFRGGVVRIKIHLAKKILKLRFPLYYFCKLN